MSFGNKTQEIAPYICLFNENKTKDIKDFLMTEIKVSHNQNQQTGTGGTHMQSQLLRRQI
jgi:hypothetical protein